MFVQFLMYFWLVWQFYIHARHLALSRAFPDKFKMDPMAPLKVRNPLQGILIIVVHKTLCRVSVEEKVELWSDLKSLLFVGIMSDPLLCSEDILAFLVCLAGLFLPKEAGNDKKMLNRKTSFFYIFFNSSFPLSSHEARTFAS